MSTPQDFQPAFKRVQQENDHDCALACIAMITGKTLAEVKQVAFDKNYMKHGPYWISEEVICKLLAHFGWTATFWKESTGLASLPDIAIGMVEYDHELEVGRHILFHRQFSGSKQAVEYLVDPAYWIPVEKQVRVDIKGFPISWFIGVTPMNPPATGKK